jgi:uncharacterized membrane protein SpoIIM required for sporulation
MTSNQTIATMALDVIIALVIPVITLLTVNAYHVA